MLVYFTYYKTKCFRLNVINYVLPGAVRSINQFYATLKITKPNAKGYDNKIQLFL